MKVEIKKVIWPSLLSSIFLLLLGLLLTLLFALSIFIVDGIITGFVNFVFSKSLVRKSIFCFLASFGI